MSKNNDENDELRKKYPVSDFYTAVLDGFDIRRTNNKIEALIVVVDNNGKKDLRLHRWRKKGENWKIELARGSVKDWNFNLLAENASELKIKHAIF